jgi:NitT/TauT family transport system substrate-binding protein
MNRYLTPLARRTALATLAASGLLAIAACGSSASSSGGGTAASGSTTNMTFMTDYNAGGLYAPLVYGIDSGIYKAAGINLTIQYGKGSSVTASSIAQGQVTVGDVSLASLAAAVGQGAKVEAVGMFTGTAEFGIFVPQSSGITTVGGLKGKTLIQTSGGAVSQLLPVVLQKNGLSASNVKIVTVGTTAALSSYEDGQADGLAYGIPNADPTVQKARASTVLSYADNGAAEPGYGLAFADSYVKSNPNLVRAFLAATYKSIAGALQNESTAVSDFQKANPTLQASVIQGQFDAYKQYMCSPTQSKAGQPLGEPNTSDLNVGFALMHQYQDVPASVTPSSVVTSQFFSGGTPVSTLKCPIAGS